MNTRISAVILGGIGLLLAAPSIAATTTLYDNFASGTIDPSKWFGGASDYLTLDTVREITPRQKLHLATTGYSLPQDDGGSMGGTYGLYFTNPQGIVGVSYSVQVNKAVATVCPSNPGAEVVTGPEFRGRFFNTQANPTSQLGDVEIAVGFDRRPGDVNGALSAAYIYQECANADCTLHNTLGQGVLGTVQPGSINKIGVRWDKAHHRFLITVNGRKGGASYFVSDASAPFVPDKEMDVARVIPNCAAAPRPYTSVDVSIDNVSVTR